MIKANEAKMLAEIRSSEMDKETMGKLRTFVDGAIRCTAEGGERKVLLTRRDIIEVVGAALRQKHLDQISAELEENGFAVAFRPDANGLSNLEIVW